MGDSYIPLLVKRCDILLLLFPDFSKKNFLSTFPWSLEFPVSSFPWPVGTLSYTFRVSMLSVGWCFIVLIVVALYMFLYLF